MRNLYNAITIAIFCLLGSHVLAQAPWQSSLNPMAQYYQAQGWPGWSDAIRWGVRLNMAQYNIGANDFEKFENARDFLAANGGGVLYYPAGTYDFRDHPTGPMGRGLMLKTGVVILGDAPTTDVKAAKDSITSGLSSLGTKFLFPFRSRPSLAGRPAGEVPDTWNQIGLYAGNGQTISDQINVGIAWVNIVGGYVFFGPNLEWASTYRAINGLTDPNRSYRPSRNSIFPGNTMAWSDRRPDGTHPADAMFGAIKDGNYSRSAGGRFVFGCRLDHSAVTDEYMENRQVVNGVVIDSADADAYHTFRFTARLTADGGNIFVANNSIPKSDKNFYYEQRFRRHTQVVAGSPWQRKIILFDYAKTGGLDINKSLITRAANRCNYITGPFGEENVVIKDNFVYSHGHKGYELAGKWMVIKNNVNERDFLREGDDVYGLGATGQTPIYELTLDGLSEAGVNSDNMSRAFDLSSFCAWIDGNYYRGTGSTPGNDGEGILYQPQGGVAFASTAETHNRQGSTGKDGYIAPWDSPIYGMFQGWNRQRGNVGLLKADNNRVEDAVCVENYNPISGQPNGQSGLNGSNIGDLSFDCPTTVMVPPTNVQAIPDFARACIKVSWEDAGNNEVAFRVDRRAGASRDWVTIAYRPRNQTGSIVNNWTIEGCVHAGALDLNPQEWYDYLAVPGLTYSYRVLALNCADDSSGAAPETNPVLFPVGAKERFVALQNVQLYPNPATNQITIGNAKDIEQSTIYDAQQRVVAKAGKGQTTISTATLAPGLYLIQIKTANGIATKRFMKR